MPTFLDRLMPTVEAMEDAPAAFSTTLQSLMAFLRTTSRDANVHAFADAVVARIPELVGANVANTAVEPKGDDGGQQEQEGAAAPEGDPTEANVEGGTPAAGDGDEASPEGSDAVVVPGEDRRERPSAQEVKTSAPAAADNEPVPPTPMEPDTAPPAGGFAGFSRHADGAE